MLIKSIYSSLINMKIVYRLAMFQKWTSITISIQSEN